MSHKSLVALPVFNEVDHVGSVLNKVAEYSDDVVVIDDGSTDGTSEILARRRDIQCVRHDNNRGYGGALITAFDFAMQNGYDVLVTIDCDGQHQPCRIPRFVDACISDGADIVSGSRYLHKFAGDSQPPEQRRWINREITQYLNERLGFELSDAFCGFKAYRVSSLARLGLTELGYAMPLELWVQAACHEFKIVEVPVPLIYLDEERSFGGALDNGATRLKYYHQVLERAFNALPSKCHQRLTGELAG